MLSRDGSSDVCSSDLLEVEQVAQGVRRLVVHALGELAVGHIGVGGHRVLERVDESRLPGMAFAAPAVPEETAHRQRHEVFVPGTHRSEEHTSELQSLMRISYAVFCLKKKKT